MEYDISSNIDTEYRYRVYIYILERFQAKGKRVKVER